MSRWLRSMGWLLLWAATVATAQDMVAPASNYKPLAGEEFFVLSEASFGTDEMATVRVEMQSGTQELEEYGGVDLVLYRVPEPLAFLRAQSNLHRVRVPNKLQTEGMGNMLRLAWDKTWANTRYAWKRLFSADTRRATTDAAPELKTPADLSSPTRLRHPAPYALLPGLKLVDRFRYPVQVAQAIEPPKGVELAGSSSDFMPRNEGNVRVPLGRLSAGLYLVEAYVGKHRALTMVFVSDSVAITKNSSSEMLVWVAQRKAGQAVRDAQVAWSDGVGVLKTSTTDANGVARLGARSPETSYVFGVDPQGGVFVSENFYHDSEIYNAKLYAVTDRPLYRPGDRVQVKFLGREFVSARESKPVVSGPIDLTVVDPAGTEVLTQKLNFEATKGAEASFRLPEGAQAGGWELIFSKGADRYGAAFRVANYVKPHFEVDVVLDKPEFKTKEMVTGRVRLLYPDGAPVANALVRMTARAQVLNMVEGELRYGGQFPVAIQANELRTDADGQAKFSLPAATDPSRYILSLLAQDGAAYRVRATKEVLIERGATLWQIAAPTNFSKPGEAVAFRFSPQGGHAEPSRPVRWEALRLEDRSLRQGDLAATADSTRIEFATAGSYTVSLRDAKGNLLAAAPHWVSGEGMKAVAGSVEIVFDKERYNPGDTAHALITFAQPVEQALLTLERDNVEATALLQGRSDWVTLTRMAPNQWRADVVVKESHGPNVTFSVLHVLHGDYVFQNKGLRVAVPAVEVAVKAARARYAPGDMVTLEIETKERGKPVPAQVTLGVVDEMIYVLQPEIAPTIGEFFYHPRRNNVRTVASLSFIGYDLARMPGKGGAPITRQPSERGVKVLERPRRDDTDTAAWWPTLNTDASGKATVSFRMPDALTRWRMTARAMTAAGVVGQSTSHVESHKPFYAKWSGPSTFRQGDVPSASIVAFNQTGQTASVQLSVQGAGLNVQRELKLAPGANTVLLPIEKPTTGDAVIALKLDGKEIDSLSQRVSVLPDGWMADRMQVLELRDAQTPLSLPADARDIKLSLAQGAAAHFVRNADDLIDDPWGCVEQTASRLLPLALVYRGLPADEPRLRDMAQTLATQRLRLIQMAGPEAWFGWWGVGTADSAWLTAYAYYADWHASRALGLKLPPDHWNQVLSAYTKYGAEEPLPLRTLSVWFMQEMGLPVRTLVEGLVQAAGDLRVPDKLTPFGRNSEWLGEGSASGAITLTLMAQLAKQQQVALPPELAQRSDAAREALRAAQDGPGLALLAMEGKVPRTDAARALAALGPLHPTLDRALALVWWNKALGGAVPAATALKGLTPTAAAWKVAGGALGAPTWRWSGPSSPSSIDLAAAPSEPVSAVVRFRSAEKTNATWPVTVERKLYKLLAVPTAAGKSESASSHATAPAGDAVEFTLEPVADADIRANVLYMEEVRVTPKEGISPRLGLLEVPLPPGADVERGTWGIRVRNLAGNGEVLPMERARHQSGELFYAVPLDKVGPGGAVTRHLLRFGQRGQFVLPPARFHRVYQPEDKAYEAVTARRVKVQ